MKKNTKLYSILKFKCPRCHQGDFFETQNPYKIKKLGEVKKKCSSCNQSYFLEPGFYYGSMYVSYAIGVAIFVSIWLSTQIIYPEAQINWYLTSVSSILFIGTPYIYCLSKIIWANIFIQYKSNSD